jgi:hypothetical protein
VINSLGNSWSKEGFQVARPFDSPAYLSKEEGSGASMVPSQVQSVIYATPERERPISNQVGEAVFAPASESEQNKGRISNIMASWIQRAPKIVLVIKSPVENQQVTVSILCGS